MHKVYAVDPDALKGFTPVWQALESCGFEHGRLLAQYPKRWLAKVYDACVGCSETERKRFETALSRLKTHGLVASDAAYDGTLDWRTNAHSQSQHFAAIIQSDNPDRRDFILAAIDLHGENTSWNVKRELSIPRTATAISDFVSPLLQHSHEVAFVDRYYSGKRSQNNTIGACIQKLGPARAAAREIVIHTAETDRPDDLRAGAQYLLRHLPQDTTLRVKCWRQRDGAKGFHARYLLTERGGFRIDWGFEEHETQATDIALLSAELHAKRWEELRSETWGCDKVRDLLIK